MKASDVQAKIAKYCAKNRIYCNKTIGMSKAGFPDVIVVKDSKPMFFEVKVGADKLSALQIHTINQLNKEKEIAFVVTCFEEFKEIMDTMDIEGCIEGAKASIQLANIFRSQYSRGEAR